MYLSIDFLLVLVYKYIMSVGSGQEESGYING